jgi:hypothetical protein
VAAALCKAKPNSRSSFNRGCEVAASDDRLQRHTIHPGASRAPGRHSENVETKSPNPGAISLTLLLAVLKAIVIALGKRGTSRAGHSRYPLQPA